MPVTLFLKFKCGLSGTRLNYAEYSSGGSKYGGSLIALARDSKSDNGPVFSRSRFRGRLILNFPLANYSYSFQFEPVSILLLCTFTRVQMHDSEADPRAGCCFVECFFPRSTAFSHTVRQGEVVELRSFMARQLRASTLFGGLFRILSCPVVPEPDYRWGHDRIIARCGSRSTAVAPE